MNPRTIYLAELEQHRMREAEQIALYAEHMPDLPDTAWVHIGWSLDALPWITFPYDRALIQTVKEALEAQGWTMSFEKDESEIDKPDEHPRQWWSKPVPDRVEYPYRAGIIVEFSDAAPGATCKRRLIGNQTKETPVYEFTCLEG